MTQPQQPQQRNLFDFFDDDAKQTVQRARDEVVRTKRDAIGPEHLLLGMLSIEGAVARRIVEQGGVDVEAFRAEIDAVAGKGTVEEVPQQLPFTARGQQVMQLLVQVMGSLAHRTVGTEHLLLTLLQDPEGVGAKALERLGVAREEVGKQLSEHHMRLRGDEQLTAPAAAWGAEAHRQQPARAAGGAQAARPAGGGQLSPSAQRVLQAAAQQAGELRHSQVGTVHLLLALVTDPDRMANNVFVRLGVRPEDVRAEIMSQLRAEDPGEPEAAPAGLEA